MCYLHFPLAVFWELAPFSFIIRCFVALYLRIKLMSMSVPHPPLIFIHFFMFIRISSHLPSLSLYGLYSQGQPFVTVLLDFLSLACQLACGPFDMSTLPLERSFISPSGATNMAGLYILSEPGPGQSFSPTPAVWLYSSLWTSVTLGVLYFCSSSFLGVSLTFHLATFPTAWDS